MYQHGAPCILCLTTFRFRLAPTLFSTTPHLHVDTPDQCFQELQTPELYHTALVLPPTKLLPKQNIPASEAV